MKKTFVILICMFLISQISFTQSGWFWQNPFPTGNSLLTVKFIDPLNGWLGGSNGNFLRTSDGGYNWVTVQTGITAFPIYDICFASGTVFYAVSGGFTNPIVLKSTDAGINWFNTTAPPNGDYIFSVSFLDANTGYVGSDYGKIFKTTDGGSSWTLQSTSIDPLYSMFALDQNKAFAVGGGGKIARTINGGSSWSVYQTTTTSNLTSVQFLDANTGFIAGNKVFVTRNGGTVWDTIPFYVTGMNSVFFNNLNTGYTVGNNGKIYKTTDSGLNWTNETNAAYGNLNSVYFSDINTGYACGSNGFLIKTTNGGVNWTFLSSRITNMVLRSIAFPNSNTGYAIGNGSYVRTTNHGIVWSLIPTGFSSQIYYSMYFFDVNTGYLADYNGAIIKTTNAGDNWVLSSQMLATIMKITFVDRDTGYLAGSKVMKTTNAGQNWIQLSTGTSTGYQDIVFQDASTGYVLSAGIYLLKTTDCGMNWSSLQIGTGGGYTYNKLCLVNRDTAFAMGYGYLLRTKDNFSTWEARTGFGNLQGITFLNDNVGYVVGQYGIIWKTTNAGENWISQVSPTSLDLYDVKFTDPNSGYTCGVGGVILGTNNGGSLVGVQQVENQIPSSLFLHQNYPNPFNPVTKIKFDIPVRNGRDRSVKLIIYDILGREVTTLVNEQLKPGTYEVDWDGSNYASGIYFYSLQTGEFTETKKMLMIK